jgi:NAD(P)-dependent dehydrogenase (short-subunit alcohol dehydrogenase family)
MARACAEAGAKAIALFDANQELGDTSAAELHAKTGLPVTFYKVDVRNVGAINAAVQSVTSSYGTPDVLINSAGIADSNIPAETYEEGMFRRLIDINLTGSFLVSQAVGRAAIAAGKPASIVLIASMSGGIVNYPQEQSCYNASKAGVVQLGRSLAAEWAKYNIRVNCSEYHFFHPSQIPIFRPMECSRSHHFRSRSRRLTWISLPWLHGHRPQQGPRPRRPEEGLDASHPAGPPRQR